MKWGYYLLDKNKLLGVLLDFLGSFFGWANRYTRSKSSMDTTLKSVKMLKGDLSIWSKCRWDGKKSIFGKLMRLIF